MENVLTFGKISSSQLSHSVRSKTTSIKSKRQSTRMRMGALADINELMTPVTFKHPGWSKNYD